MRPKKKSPAAHICPFTCQRDERTATFSAACLQAPLLLEREVAVAEALEGDGREHEELQPVGLDLLVELVSLRVDPALALFSEVKSQCILSKMHGIT